jgi:hypothetical protein
LVQQSDLVFNRKAPGEGHLDMTGLNRRRSLAHGDIASNANQAPEFSKPTTQHAGLPGSLAGDLKHCPHARRTKMRDLAVPSDFLGDQPREQPPMLLGVLHHGTGIDLIASATDARA